MALSYGVEMFYQEYNRLPDLPSMVRTDSKAGVALLQILLGDEDSPDAENPRRIRFLEVKEAKKGRDGIDYGDDLNGSVQGMFDSYGHPYHVVLNKSYEPVFEFDYAGALVRLEGRMVAVFSVGKDGRLGTKDDVRSW